MSDCKYIRNKAIISSINNVGKIIESTNHETVNKAKNASRLLQLKEDGGLGLGSLQIKK